jgi:transcription initiation factor TFIID TATA-box-binding protein
MSNYAIFDVAVENVVVTARFRHGLDLSALVKIFPQARPMRRFPALVYKLKRPRVTMLIYASGKIVCTGAKSEREASSVIGGFVETMRQKGFVFPSPHEVKVENAVVSALLRTSVNAKEAVKRLNATVYEPEGFPGVVVKFRDVEPSFLVFSTGKVVCVGLKTVNAAKEAIAVLEKKLNEL